MEIKMKSFEEAWNEKGYQYGSDALENVQLGWNMAIIEASTMFLNANVEISEEDRQRILAQIASYKANGYV